MIHGVIQAFRCGRGRYRLRAGLERKPQFGDRARRRYERLLATALRTIGADPECVESVPRPELGQGIRSYHLLHSRERARTDEGIVRRPRHFLLYRAINPDVVGIGRVLHDAMDLMQNVPPDFGDE